MAGGIVGYLGYDMVRQMEHLPADNPDPIGLPDAILLRPTLFAIFDNVRDELTLAAPAGRCRAKPPKPRSNRPNCAWTPPARLWLARPPPPAAPPVALPPQPTPTSNFGPGAYAQAVTRARAYIAAGDAFQVVPSQRFSAPFALPPLSLYRALRRINPAPFLFFLDFGGFRHCRLQPRNPRPPPPDGRVTIRPLAGTRPRGDTVQADEALARELLADPKERAEHLMLVDLGRNDVGRVARPGSVRVTESFAIERFSHVMHISSTVEGILAPGLDAVDALAAGFPAGTLTGAPKIRAMEIIEELEPVRRGIYGGCIGYFAADGTMDTCIALRTALIKDGVMHVQAGAGVVADSVPEAEEAETQPEKPRAVSRGGGGGAVRGGRVKARGSKARALPWTRRGLRPQTPDNN